MCFNHNKAGQIVCMNKSSYLHKKNICKLLHVPTAHDSQLLTLYYITHDHFNNVVDTNFKKKNKKLLQAGVIYISYTETRYCYN